MYALQPVDIYKYICCHMKWQEMSLANWLASALFNLYAHVRIHLLVNKTLMPTYIKAAIPCYFDIFHCCCIAVYGDNTGQFQALDMHMQVVQCGATSGVVSNRLFLYSFLHVCLLFVVHLCPLLCTHVCLG